MIIYPEDAQERILIEAFAPRPLAWFITQSGNEAKMNIAPFSALTLTGNTPPIIFFSILLLPNGEQKTTTKNILINRELTINFPSSEQLPNLMRSADPSIPSSQRITTANISIVPGHRISTGHIANANYVFECTLLRHEFFEIGQSDMFWCHVHTIHSKKELGPTYSPTPFTGTIGYHWFVTEHGLIFLDQKYIDN